MNYSEIQKGKEKPDMKIGYQKHGNVSETMTAYNRNQKIKLAYNIKTRPDARPIPVADRWAGAVMRVFTLFDSCSRTDGPTDQRTDKGSYKLACPALKKNVL